MKKLIILILTLLPLSVFASQKEDNAGLVLGGLVQSDRWIIHKDSSKEEFIGNVRYENDNYSLKADYGLSDRKNDIYTLRGNILARQTTPGAEAHIKAEEIVYNHKNDSGYILPKKNKQAEAVYKTPSNNFYLFADKITFKDKFSFFNAQGSAELQDFKNTLYADEISYNLKTGAFEAFGSRPVIWGFADDGDYAAQADSFTALTKEQIYKAKGRVSGWITINRDLKSFAEAGKEKGKEQYGTKSK